VNVSENLTWPDRHSKKLHLDRRAGQLRAEGEAEGAPDDLLTVREVAAWLGMSEQWLALGRRKGYGPVFIRLSPQDIRYRRSAVLQWLREREYRSTIEYSLGRGGHRKPRV
jgi:predicted DNA-binding transcriptional regulator AlpA